MFEKARPDPNPTRKWRSSKLSGRVSNFLYIFNFFKCNFNYVYLEKELIKLFLVCENSSDESFISANNDASDDELDDKKVNCSESDDHSEDTSIDFDFDSEDFDCNSSFSSESCASSTEDEDSQEKDNNFKNTLVQWALLYNIPLIALTALLLILIQFTNYSLPRCARTLLRTPRTANIIRLSDGGEYLHLGLIPAIDAILKNRINKTTNSENTINLMVNVDGLPIHKSSKKSLWLILCSEENSDYVHLVGAYYAGHQPEDFDEFLVMFIDEAKTVCEDGFNSEGRQIEVNVYGLICDGPAKCKVLNIKNHTGYNCCPKCDLKGEGIKPKTWRKNQKKKRRVCFPGIGPFTERTDSEFKENKYMGSFQKKQSTLTEIPRFGAISNVPVDPMHVVFLGIMKKIILLLLLGPPSVRPDRSEIDKISTQLIELRKSQPSDFSRRPRTLRDIKFWKATELRNFLLYSGPIVLKSILTSCIDPEKKKKSK